MPTSIGQKATSAGPTALTYITIGALLSVWSGVWYAYEHSKDNASQGVSYICLGLILTGVALLVIGFVVGNIAHRAHEVSIAQDAAKVNAIQKDPAVAQRA